MQIFNDLNKKIALIGYTGFVGSNLMLSYDFEYCYNSKNIQEAYGKEFDILIYSGVRAEKFIANSNPNEDKILIEKAIENIKKINFNKLVLISTVDIYPNPVDVDEDSIIDKNEQAYGRNRYYLENWIRDNINDYHILRLPALFGKNLKKNFIYDMIKIVPSMLKKEKYIELSKKYNDIEKCYYLDGDFYKLKNIDEKSFKKLKEFFENNDFNALSFTDSRNFYQFYNLALLWKDIKIVIENNIKTLNLSVEPIMAKDLYKNIFNKDFDNITNNTVSYNMKSKYYKLFNGKNGYLYCKNSIMEDIKNMVEKAIK